MGEKMMRKRIKPLQQGFSKTLPFIILDRINKIVRKKYWSKKKKKKLIRKKLIKKLIASFSSKLCNDLIFPGLTVHLQSHRLPSCPTRTNPPFHIVSASFFLLAKHICPVFDRDQIINIFQKEDKNIPHEQDDAV
jgi:hypothetical protein